MGTVGCGLAIECPRGTCGYEPPPPPPPPPKPRDWLVVTSQEPADSHVVAYKKSAWADLAPPRFQKIRQAVCEQLGVSYLEIISHRREQRIVRARMACMYLAKKLTSYSLPQIGLKSGGFDHTSVHHAIGRIASLRITDPTMDAAITAIEITLQTQELPDV